MCCHIGNSPRVGTGTSPPTSSPFLAFSNSSPSPSPPQKKKKQKEEKKQEKAAFGSLTYYYLRKNQFNNRGIQTFVLSSVCLTPTQLICLLTNGREGGGQAISLFCLGFRFKKRIFPSVVIAIFLRPSYIRGEGKPVLLSPISRQKYIFKKKTHLLHGFLAISKYSLMRLLILLLLALLSLCLSEETPASHALPRPLIIEYPTIAKELDVEHVRLRCDSWRFAVEANNVNPWKTVPQECADYVSGYMTANAYGFDLDRVSNEAGVYAGSVELGGDGKDAWVFDIDETLLSNLPYYAEHGFG